MLFLCLFNSCKFCFTDNFPKLKDMQEFSFPYDTTWKVSNSQNRVAAKVPIAAYSPTTGAMKAFKGFTVLCKRSWQRFFYCTSGCKMKWYVFIMLFECCNSMFFRAVPCPCSTAVFTGPTAVVLACFSISTFITNSGYNKAIFYSPCCCDEAQS